MSDPTSRNLEARYSLTNTVGAVEIVLELWAGDEFVRATRVGPACAVTILNSYLSYIQGLEAKVAAMKEKGDVA